MSHAGRLVLFGIYGAWCLLAASQATPQPFGDTYRYVEYSILDIQNPGILASFILQTAANETQMMWFQVVLSMGAWIFLSWSVMDRLARGWAGLLLGSAVLLFSLTPPIWSWNTLLASESSSISVAVAWLASIVAVSKSGSGARLWVFVLMSVLLCVARPQLALVVAAVAVTVLVWRYRGGEARLSIWLGAGGVAAGLVWAVYRLQLLAGEASYRSYYALNNFVDKAGSYREYALSRMPDCEPLSALLAGPNPWGDMFAFRANSLMGTCPETYVWFKSPASSTTAWLTAEPLTAISGFLGSIPNVLVPIYSDGRALPDGISLPPLTSGSVWGLVLVALIVGISVALGVGGRWVARWPGFVAGVGVIGALLASGMLVWAADGIEYDRHWQPISTLVIMAALLMPSALFAPRVDRARQRCEEASTTVSG